VRDVEVTIIVCHRDDGFLLRGEVGQQLFVEILTEFRVLIGCPFIEDIDRAVL
jgi:hypothetical protein